MERRYIPSFVLFALSAFPAFAGVASAAASQNFQVDPYAPARAGAFEVVPGKKSPWSFTLEPYGWLPSLNGGIGVKGLPATHVDFSPKTLLSNLKWGVFAKGEARYGRWGLLGDGLFVDLQADADAPGRLYKSASLTIQQGLAQLALAYRVWEGRSGYVDLYAGARYNYLGIKLGADLDDAGIQQVGSDASQRVVDRVRTVAGTLVDDAAAALSDRVHSQIDAARQQGVADLDALQQRIQAAIADRKTADIERLQALQSQIVKSLRARIANGIERTDDIKSLVADALQSRATNRAEQIAAVRDRIDAAVQQRAANLDERLAALKSDARDDVRRRVAGEFVERWADFSSDVRSLEARSDLRRDFRSVRREFADLVAARVQRQVALARAELARNLAGRMVDLARDRVDAARKVLDLARRNSRERSAASERSLAKLAPGSNIEAAKRLLASSRAQLAAARAGAVDAARTADTGKLDRKIQQAQKKLEKAIANRLEESLPTDAAGDVWWVDPIVGIRAQLDLTRWLFVATQCDAGGFGAGSQIAWNLNATVGVNWTRNLFTELGYRYYYVDYQRSGVTYDMAEAGVFVGVGVKF